MREELQGLDLSKWQAQFPLEAFEEAIGQVLQLTIWRVLFDMRPHN